MSAIFIGHPKETHLALFAGGELGPVARWRIERHLQNCESCQATVSDFFHLQADLTELSELPSSIDWDGMALRIRQEVARADRAQPEPGFFSKPLVLRFGLATATVLCGFIVIQQWPLGQTPQSMMTAQSESVGEVGGVRLEEQAKAPESDELLSSARTNLALADQDAKSVNEVLAKGDQAFAAPQESAQLQDAQFRDAQNKQKDVVTASGQSLPGGSLPGDKARAAEPAAPGKKSSDESFRAASDLRANAGNVRGAGREANSEAKELSAASAPARAMAPATPSAPPNTQGAAAGEADATRSALVDQIQRRVDGPTPELERAAAVKSEVSADRMTLAEVRSASPVGGQAMRQKTQVGQEGTALGMRPTAVPTSIAPPSAAGQDVEVDVNMDGGLRYRTVDAATGRITITDVYAP